MSSRSKSTKRNIDQVADGAILVVKSARDASDSIPVLTPLRGSLGMVITLLENVKKARKNKEDWISLVQTLEGRLKAVQDAVVSKPPSAALDSLVSKYSEVIERITRELGPLAEGQSNWLRAALSADKESNRIKESIKEIDEAFNRFTTELQMLIRVGIEDIQDKQEGLGRIVEAQGRAHTRAYSDQRDMMEKIQMEQKDTNIHISEIDEINLIKGLQTATMASGDIHQKCMEGTRQPILKEVERWRTNAKSPQVLWVADVAGSGKSTIAKEIAEKWKDQGCLAGRFFFSRDAEETRTPKLFFSTIAQQGVAQLDSRVRATVAVGIRKLINPVSASLEEQCLVIFVEPIKKTRRSTVLVLDALDECEPQTCQQLLRTLLSHLPELPHLKLFITSRPETHIRTELEGIAYREVSLRSDEIANSKDVELFMNERLQKISLTETQREQLIERAGGLFIWAKTVCDLLQNFRGNKISFINRIISQNLRQIDSIYRIALDQAIGSDTEEENMEAFMNVLYVVVVAFEPISPNTIDRLLKTSESMNIVNDLRSVLECGSSDSAVRFLHPTFREFLLNKDVCGQYYVDLNTAHEAMSRGCLSVMGDELEYDICKLYDGRNRKFKPEELDERCLQHTSSALRYSCISWASHINQLDHSVLPSLTLTIEGFFTSKLLDWLYMVSMQGSIDKASRMLHKLISNGFIDDIRRWSMDAARFLRLHWNTIRDTPLKVYHLFAFAPRSSIFHQVYSKMESFPHPIVIMGTDEDWPSGMAIQTYPIKSSRLSSSEDLLATGGLREGFAAFTVWDIKTMDRETSTHPCMSRDCHVSHVSFHPKGEKIQLRTGCACGKLCRWDISSDTHSLLNETHLKPHGTFIWWSDDGSKVISKIFPKDPYIIPSQRQELHPPIDGLYRLSIAIHPPIYYEFPGYYIDKWIFSPGKGDKVLQITDGTLNVWNCSSRHARFKKKYQDNPKYDSLHACFSPDGTIIICIDVQERAMEVISAEDGSVIQTIPNSTLNIKFFSTGKELILWSQHAISLFNGEFHRGVRIGCGDISISPDDERIAVISDRSVDIFNRTLDERPEHHKLITPSTRFPQFPQLKLYSCRLLSWRHSTLVSIEVTEGSSISFHRLSPVAPSTLPIHRANPDISRLFLSPDGRYLLTLSLNGRLSLWDGRSATEVHPISNLRLVPAYTQVKYMADSSWAFVWDSTQLLVLYIPACRWQIIWLSPTSHTARSLPSQNPKLIASSFLSNPPSFFVLLGILNMDPIYDPIRDLVISPTERLAAICSGKGLIVDGIGQEVHQVPVLSTEIWCSQFSPDGAYIYALQKDKPFMKILRVDSLDWTVKTIYALVPPFDVPRIELVHGGSWSALRIEPQPFEYRETDFLGKGPIDTFFIDSQAGRQIIPSSIEFRGEDIWYGDAFLMTPRPKFWDYTQFISKSHDYVAYIDDGKVVLVDLSLLIRQARNVQGFTDVVETWRTKWLGYLEQYVQKKIAYARIGKNGSYREVLKMIMEEDRADLLQQKTPVSSCIDLVQNLVCVRSYGSLREVLAMITNGDQGEPLRARVEAIHDNEEAMQDLEGIWNDDGLIRIRKDYFETSAELDTHSPSFSLLTIPGLPSLDRPGPTPLASFSIPERFPPIPLPPFDSPSSSNLPSHPGRPIPSTSKHRPASRNPLGSIKPPSPLAGFPASCRFPSASELPSRSIPVPTQNLVPSTIPDLAS